MLSPSRRATREARHEQELLQKELDTKQAELDAQVEAAYTMIADIETLSDDAQAEYDAIAEEEAKAEETLQGSHPQARRGTSEVQPE